MFPDLLNDGRQGSNVLLVGGGSGFEGEVSFQYFLVVRQGSSPTPTYTPSSLVYDHLGYVTISHSLWPLVVSHTGGTPTAESVETESPRQT